MADVDRFGDPLGMPFGIKLGSENEVQKKSEKASLDKVRDAGSGSLKELESTNQQLADGH